MAKDLEQLVELADSDIRDRGASKAVVTRESLSLPRFSMAMGIWLCCIIAITYQLEPLKDWLLGVTESQIEKDLSSVLDNAANSLTQYEDKNGELPLLLPNPAIRGLVTYRRTSDFSYELEATLGDVTMMRTSTQRRAARKNR